MTHPAPESVRPARNCKASDPASQKLCMGLMFIHVQAPERQISTTAERRSARPRSPITCYAVLEALLVELARRDGRRCRRRAQ
ncbi:hypothetical protein GWI33_015979 [Rhynchophorus ferrugineus]|uniref:Uncharacterized protein n=1 Tax=Rhynchophorus ferrugineus TaxID=354439 RepID=A0A834M5E8_RHYFE|nr:hypothetical protein GWI33_015979 [Rhynchophorus ferrugineus]